ncbi:MAG: hypothetical protein GXO88_05335 [Chlorobi bacterium]|nr:hypothetical protein [Chlorobiota bacterium]
MRICFYIMLSLFSASAGRVLAQDIPPPNPSMVISIVSGYSVSFLFDQMDEYKNGILNGGQQTFIRIGAVNDWKLQFKADQNIFYGDNNPANQMELNNVGLVVQSTGTNQDDGSNIINYAKPEPLALSGSDQTLMTKGSGSNRGFENRNSFTLNWEMGTKRGNMNNQSILEQMIEADTYTVSIILTLSPAN